MKVRMMAAAAALAVAVGGGAVAAATAASAMPPPPPLQAELYANGTSTAVWNAYGDPVLTAGNTAGDSAQVDLAGSYAGQQAPTDAPTFTASQAGGGDPRWVIELHNGCYVFGYTTGTPNASASEWSANPGGPQATSYATAIGWAQNCGTDNWVTAAFIVDDQGYQGNTVTLTNVTYDGQLLYGAVPDVAKGYDGKVLDDYRSGTSDGNPVDLYAPNGTKAQLWTLEPDGTLENEAAGQTMCLDDPGWGGQGAKVDMYKCVYGQANEQWSYSTVTSGQTVLVNKANGLCLNDPGYATANGTRQILWACGNYGNENYTLVNPNV